MGQSFAVFWTSCPSAEVRLNQPVQLSRIIQSIMVMNTTASPIPSTTHSLGGQSSQRPRRPHTSIHGPAVAATIASSAPPEFAFTDERTCPRTMWAQEVVIPQLGPVSYTHLT